jgi:hypothetical protein
MNEVIRDIFKAAFQIWDSTISISIDMFRVSVKNTQYQDIYNLAADVFEFAKNLATPAAALFFMIAIYKSVVSVPPEQQAKRFLTDAMKYGVVIFTINKLWEIIEHIITIADTFTNQIPTVPKTDLANSTGAADIENVINFLKMDLEEVDMMDFGETIKQFFDQLGPYILFFMGGLISLIILTGAALTVLTIAYQRLIKPLLIIPFSAVVVGMSCCSGEGDKLMWNLCKQFVGLCLSGAFMLLAIKMGSSVSEAILAPTREPLYTMIGEEVQIHYLPSILAMVKVDMQAILIMGLLKSMQAMISKTFG